MRHPHIDAFLARVHTFLGEHPQPPPKPLDPRLMVEFVESLRDLPLFASSELRLSIEAIDLERHVWWILASTDPATEIGVEYTTAHGLTGWAVRKHRVPPLYVNTQHPMPSEVTPIPMYKNVQSAFVWTLLMKQRPVGAVCVVSDKIDAISPELAEALRYASWHIRIALVGLESGQGKEITVATRESYLSAGTPFEEWLGRLFEQKKAEREYENAYFWSWDPDHQQLTPTQITAQESTRTPPPFGALKLGEGFVGSVAKNLQPLQENDINEGEGRQTKITTPYRWMSSGVMIRSILAYPVHDENKLYGVISLLSDVRNHFVYPDAGLKELVDVITDHFQNEDQRQIDAAQGEIARSLLRCLASTDAPTQFWGKLNGLLKKLEDCGFCEACALYVSKRTTSHLFACKSSSPKAASLRSQVLDAQQHEALRNLLRMDDGVGDLEGKRASLRPLFPAGTVRFWVMRYPPDPDSRNLPNFIAIVSLDKGTPWEGRYGRRDMAPVLSQIFTNIFSITRALLNAADLVRSNKERLQVMSAATHELGGSVAKLKTKACSLKDLTEENAKLQREFILAADEMMLKIDNLLYQWYLAKSENHVTPKGELERVDPWSLIEDLVRKLRSHHDTYQIKLDMVSKQEDLFLRVNRDTLGMAIYNVLDNAVRFGENQPIDVILKVTSEYDEPAHRKSPRIQFEILDRGIGIPRENLKIIFEAGRRHKHSRKFVVSGSNMGLSITKEIIEGYGGRIWPQPSATEKKETRMIIQLPAFSI